jgi:hypothetical protein
MCIAREFLITFLDLISVMYVTKVLFRKVTFKFIYSLILTSNRTSVKYATIVIELMKVYKPISEDIREKKDLSAKSVINNLLLSVNLCST